ncbi:MAG: amidohydrolase [Clostridia bacterium]|nr:amidohydrolase [Clostridia bacterium]
MKLLFKNAAILAWKDGNFDCIPDGFLGVDGDTIDYIGTDRPQAAYDLVKDMRGKLLIPGLINCHCHAAMTLLRGIGSDLPLDRWLFEAVFPVENRMKTADFIAGNELAVLEMLAGGVTAFSDMYMEPRTLIELNEQVGMKVNLTRVVQAFDPSEPPEKNVRVKESLALFDAFHLCQNGRVHVDFSVHAEYTTNDAVTRYYADQIRPYRDRGARVQVHLSETRKEHEECKQRHGMTPAAWFEAMGIFDLPTAAAHCVWCTPADLDIMKAHGVYPIHNPTSNLKLGSGFAPVPEMLDMGLVVALGTDGAASNNNLNLFEEMHLAAIIMNGQRLDPELMPPSTILRMATVNGAALQGRADTGCLAAGKKADIVAIDMDRPHLYPAFEPLPILTYSAQASDVCMTMVDGRILYENGEYLTIDREKALFDAKQAVKRLYGR